MPRSYLYASLFLLLCACGDSNETPPDETPAKGACPRLEADAIFGGTGFDNANSLAAAKDGSRFATVGFLENSADLGGGVDGTGGGQRDGFIVVSDASGAYLHDVVYSGMGEVDVADAAFTEDGGLVAVGTFQADITLDKAYTTAGDLDCFVLKLDAKGALVWSRVFGGTGREFARSVVVLPNSGNVVVVGSYGPEVDFGGGPRMSAPSGGIYVLALDSKGAYLWDKTNGGDGPIRGGGLGVDASGNLVMSAIFSDTVDVGGGPRTSAGFDDGILWSLSPDGQWRWDYVAGGSSVDSFWAVDVAPDGAVYTVLEAGETAKLAPDVDVEMGDHLVALSADGKHLWNKKIDATEFLVAPALAATPEGPVVGGYSTGRFLVPDPPLDGLGNNDAFLAAFSPTGELRYGCLYGGAGPDQASEVVVVGKKIAVAGAFEGATDLGSGIRMGKGKRDGFLAIYAQ